jgi:DNA polymerase gamma 1
VRPKRSSSHFADAPATARLVCVHAAPGLEHDRIHVLLQLVVILPMLRPTLFWRKGGALSPCLARPFSRPRLFVAHPSRRWYAEAALEQKPLESSPLPDHGLSPALQRASWLTVPESTSRVNEVGIQQLSSTLHAQVFPSLHYASDPKLVALSHKHLRLHDLLGKESAISPPINVELPALRGKTLDEHFFNIGMQAAEPYLSLASVFAKAELPPQPAQWLQQSGWTRYDKDGQTTRVDFPDENCVVFDCETLYKESPFPVMACAASTTAWYGWVSPWLLSESDSPRHLVPFGSDASRNRIVVGHNVGYDRQRIRDEYCIQATGNAFIDTMSLHVAVNGMCSQQRPTWMKHQKQKLLKEKLTREASTSLSLSELLGTLDTEDEISELWIARSSINSLMDVAQFHCNITLDKSIRDYFGELDRGGIVDRFNELMSYCASDVSTTHKVYRVVLPAFLDVCPHPVSFAAMLRLSSVFLPVDKSWERYIGNAESTYLKLSADVQNRLITLAEQALEIKDNPDRWSKDPWLAQLDWSGQEIRMLKLKKGEDTPQPAKNQKKPGLPRWYKDLFATNDAPISLTVRSRIAPLLLRLAWEGHPLVWSDKYGWVFRVLKQDDILKFHSKHFTLCDMSDEPVMRVRMDNGGVFFKVPHKDGPTKRVANPMAKGYLAAFEEGTLSSEFAYAKEALDMNAACSYWISARERIKSQMVVWDTDTNMGVDVASVDGLGMILPQIIPMGTITRRAVENTWLTASNAKKNRVGSELKAMVKAPVGYKFVGADVDSEELWIASLFGDAEFGVHGGTAIGWMTLEGTKTAGTDLHSKTAQILGISRNDAKVGFPFVVCQIINSPDFQLRAHLWSGT